MATSDNVLRGGLTPKYINAPELVKITDFSPLAPPLVEGPRRRNRPGAVLPAIRRIPAPAHRIVGTAATGTRWPSMDPPSVLAVAGSARLDSPRADLALRPGDSAFIPDSEQPVLAHPVPGSQDTAVLFAVTTSGHAGSN